MESPRETDADVVVVGGGPAGCTAGILLARAGLRVSILEKSGPGSRKVCGDLLGPRTLWLLRALRLDGVEDGAVYGIRSIGIYDDARMRSWAALGPGSGAPVAACTIRRDRFDALLQREAVRAGCRLERHVAFRSLERRTPGRVICRAVCEGAERSYRSRLILGADGSGSRVARAAGLVQRDMRRKILAVRRYYRRVGGIRNGIELFFLDRTLPGYAWVIPLGDDLANVGLGVRADAAVGKGARIRGELERWVCRHPVLRPRMRAAVPQGPLQGWPIETFGGTRRRSAPHAMLLGDAAGVSDPISGEGIFSAMQSAVLATEVAGEAFAAGDFSGRLLARYDRACERYFSRVYGSATWLAALPMSGGVMRPVVRWGLSRIQDACTVDPEYARMVGGFFTGMTPSRRMWSWRCFRRTLIA